MPPNDRRRDRGANVVEYVGLTVIVAGVIIALAAILTPRLPASLQAAVCRALGGQDCATATPASSPPATSSQPPPSQPPPGGANGNVEAEPTPDPSPGAEPSPQDTSQEEANEARNETEEVLKETELGTEALKWVEENDVHVVYKEGGGSYYDPDSNTFYVDTSQTPEERANTFVHEVNHAQSPDKPDPEELSKEDYVEAAIDEEVEGTVEGIKNNQQLEEARGEEQDDTVAQDEYEEAYEDAVDEENERRKEKGQAPLSPKEERKVGEKAGTKAVEEMFYDGSIVASTDGDSYEENYEEAWDDANSCFLLIFC